MAASSSTVGSCAAKSVDDETITGPIAINLAKLDDPHIIREIGRLLDASGGVLRFDDIRVHQALCSLGGVGDAYLLWKLGAFRCCPHFCVVGPYIARPVDEVVALQRCREGGQPLVYCDPWEPMAPAQIDNLDSFVRYMESMVSYFGPIKMGDRMSGGDARWAYLFRCLPSVKMRRLVSDTDNLSWCIDESPADIICLHNTIYSTMQRRLVVAAIKKTRTQDKATQTEGPSMPSGGPQQPHKEQQQPAGLQPLFPPAAANPPSQSSPSKNNKDLVPYMVSGRDLRFPQTANRMTDGPDVPKRGTFSREEREFDKAGHPLPFHENDDLPPLYRAHWYGFEADYQTQPQSTMAAICEDNKALMRRYRAYVMDKKKELGDGNDKAKECFEKHLEDIDGRISTANRMAFYITSGQGVRYPERFFVIHAKATSSRPDRHILQHTRIPNVTADEAEGKQVCRCQEGTYEPYAQRPHDD